MKEQTLVNHISKHLRTIPNLYVVNIHQSGRTTSAGLPDILVCHEGKFISFELKGDGGVPTFRQLVHASEIVNAGGRAIFVHPDVRFDTLLTPDTLPIVHPSIVGAVDGMFFDPTVFRWPRVTCEWPSPLMLGDASRRVASRT